MLLLLAIPVFVAVAAFHRYLAIYAPSNILIRRIRSHPARLRTVAGVIGLVCLLIISTRVVDLGIASGWPPWLNLVALVLAWDAIKVAAQAVRTAIRVTLDR